MIMNFHLPVFYIIMWMIDYGGNVNPFINRNFIFSVAIHSYINTIVWYFFYDTRHKKTLSFFYWSFYVFNFLHQASYSSPILMRFLLRRYINPSRCLTVAYLGNNAGNAYIIQTSPDLSTTTSPTFSLVFFILLLFYFYSFTFFSFDILKCAELFQGGGGLPVVLFNFTMSVDKSKTES